MTKEPLNFEIKPLKKKSDKELKALQKMALKEMNEWDKFLDEITDEKARRFNKKHIGL